MSSSSKRVLRGKIEGIDQCSKKKKKSVDCLTVGKKTHPCQDCNGRSDRTNGAAEIMRKHALG